MTADANRTDGAAGCWGWLPLLAIACAGPTSAYLVRDETTAPARQVASGASSIRLTREDRVRLENIVDRLLRRAPTPGRVTVTVLPPQLGTSAEASVEGSQIFISAGMVRWAFDQDDRWVGDNYLAFALGHEIAHLTSPACGTCRDLLACEQQQDASSRALLQKVGLGTSPAELGRMVQNTFKSLGQSLTAMRQQCSAPDVPGCVDLGVRSATSCVSLVELYFREARIWQEEWGRRTGDTPGERERISEMRASLQKSRIEEAPAVVAMCREVVGMVPPDVHPERCLAARLDLVEKSWRALPQEVPPPPSSRQLWTDAVRWQDDARWGLEGDVGPSWGQFRKPALGSGWGQTARVTANWEGSGKDNFGFRVGYGRFVREGGADADVTRLTAELVAPLLWAISPRFALGGHLGVGAVRVSTTSARSTAFQVALDGRLGWGLSSRVKLGLGFGYSAGLRARDSVVQDQTLTALGTLEVHLGTAAMRLPKPAADPG